MTWIDLGNPIPHTHRSYKTGSPRAPYIPHTWPVGEIRALGIPTSSEDKPFFSVLDSRRSRRNFTPTSTADISALLWHSTRVLEQFKSSYGFEIEMRPTPSGGAIHPIHIVIKSPNDLNGWKYDPLSHALIEIPDSNAVMESIAEHSDQLLSSSSASRLIFVAEPGKTFAKYHDGCSLIWRDAGAMLGILALVAEGLGLNFCALGITGEPWVRKLGPEGVLAGVGIALVGGR
ncbi:nitroreductase family protein [Pseudomonas syringae]